jgi:glycosyltransferase involved in cell wall biosynthesis
MAWRMLDLVRMLRAFRPQIVFSMRTYVNLYAGIAARLVGAISIGTLRNTLAYEASALGWTTRLICRLPHALAVNSTCARDELIATGWVKAEKIHVLLNVIDLADFDQQAKAAVEAVGSEGRNVFFVGRLAPAKRIDRLLKVFKLALDQAADLWLIVVGEGDERPKIERMIDDSGLDERVILLGARRDIPALLKQRATILALTSDDEGFANVIIEAMAAGVPVITTPAGDSGVIVTDGVTGFVCAADDRQGMADRIVQVVGDVTMRERLAAAGRDQVEKQYEFAMLEGRLMALFESV